MSVLDAMEASFPSPASPVVREGEATIDLMRTVRRAYGFMTCFSPGLPPLFRELVSCGSTSAWLDAGFGGAKKPRRRRALHFFSRA